MNSTNGITPHRATAPRLLIYSQDGLGLGHMRRTSAIASYLLDICADGCALTLSDSPLGQFFPTAVNHDYLKLPSIIKDGPGQWRPTRLPLAFSRIQQMRQELILTAAVHFQPNLVLVDHMPHGTLGELLPMLKVLRYQHPTTKIVLGLRDILDAPQVVTERWQMEGAYSALEEFYDMVLIYGMREIFDMGIHYHFPQTVSRRFRYCGYVCPPHTTRKQQALPDTVNRDPSVGTKVIVVMAGGGADAYPMMSATLDALPQVCADQNCHCLLITGPFMPPELRLDLQQRAAKLPSTVLPSVEDTYSYLQRADLIIAMAGYNTTVEILQTGKRAILIPRRGPSAEQRMRAQLFAGEQWVTMRDPDDINIASFAAQIVAHLNQVERPVLQSTPDLQGVEQSTHYLLSLLTDNTVQHGTSQNGAHPILSAAD